MTKRRSGCGSRVEEDITCRHPAINHFARIILRHIYFYIYIHDRRVVPAAAAAYLAIAICHFQTFRFCVTCPHSPPSQKIPHPYLYTLISAEHQPALFNNLSDSYDVNETTPTVDRTYIGRCNNISIYEQLIISCDYYNNIIGTRTKSISLYRL